MPTIPDNDGQDCDGARLPSTITLADLVRLYGDAWEIIQHAELSVWSAEHRSPDGRHIRYVVAYDLDQLAARLERAGKEEA